MDKMGKSIIQKTQIQLVRLSGFVVTVAILLGTTFQFGCNAIPPMDLKSPTLGFSDLTVSDISLDRVKFVVTVAAENPNDVDIPLSNMRFDLAVLDTALGNGTTTSRDVLIPKRSSTQVPIEFTVGTSQLLDVVRKVRIADLAKLSYSLKGSANWNNGPFSIPFERKGDLGALKKLVETFSLFLR